MDDLWVLQWGPAKNKSGNFHIDTIGGMLQDNYSVFEDMQVSGEINAQRIWIPLMIFKTEDECIQALSQFEKMGF